jgi:hypothetical protein
MKFVTFTATAIALAMAAGSVYAKVSAAEVAKLGTTLTAMGAEKAGNAAGTIPAFTGGLPMDINGNAYANPTIVAEKAMFVIDGTNVDKYKANLSDGQIALFKKYPDTFKMPVYKTHRTAGYPDRIKAKAKANALSAELIQGGNGLVNFDETAPFVIPQSGVEAIWNHVTRFRGGASEQNFALIPVQNGGNYTAEIVRSSFSPPQYLEGGADAKEDKNILFYYTAATRSPARLTGNVLLVHETIDQVKEPRKAWQYNAGQRRVRRAPQVAYDAPNTEGMRTSDQVDMYNGSPDRYNWKLVGKKEMYIPYNAYKLGDRSAKYADIIGENHLNPEFTRYELHRVWHLEATLKEGARHIYSKRELYLDEDSWQVSIADHYDSRGNLWRVAEGHALQYINLGGMWYSGNTNYDLSSGRYMAQLFNEEKDPIRVINDAKRSDFSTAALRRSGKR